MKLKSLNSPLETLEVPTAMVCATSPVFVPVDYSFASLFHLLTFHREVQVPQHEVAYACVPLVSKVLSHNDLPNIYFQLCTTAPAVHFSVQVWSSMNSRKLIIIRLTLHKW